MRTLETGIFNIGLVMIFLLFFSSVCFSGAWGRKGGELFLAPQFYYYSATKYWDADGDKKDIGCKYKKDEFAFYGEYGFSEKTTFLLRVPFIKVKCNGHDASGIGDIETGFVKKIFKGDRGVFSVQTLFIIPSGYSIYKPIRIGYGRFGLETYFLSGYGFDKVFIEGGVGCRYYKGYPSEQIRSYGRIGFKINENFMVMNTLELHYGLNTGKKKHVGKNVTLEPNYRLLQNDLFLNFKLKNNFNLGFGLIETFWGRNVGVGRNVYVQFWFMF